MSYNRVLPNPVALHHDSSQVSLPRYSNPLDHKIMNDLPMSHGALPFRPDPLASACMYPENRPNGVPQARQYVATLKRANPELSPQMGRPAGPMPSTSDLALHDRSSSSSGGSSPTRSTKEISWCLCKPDPKIPRPRNCESTPSASWSKEHGK
jgi:HMG box factor